MEARLQNEIAALELALRRTRFWRELTVGWLIAIAFAILLLLVRALTGWASPVQRLLPLFVGLGAFVFVWFRGITQPSDLRAVVFAIEREHPEIRHLLSAAAEQKPDPGSGNFRYLQTRVIDEVLQHPQRELWKRSLERRLAAARSANFVVTAVLLVSLLALGHNSMRAHPMTSSWPFKEVTVTPGDTEVERGTMLVISARFGSRPPAEATLVLVTASGKTRRIPLERHLADPVFGASLPEVSEQGIYHVEYGSEKTRDYKIAVFDYPALVRADAFLRFPDYTGLTNRTIPNTVRVSAVEGTHLTYTLQLNKSVTRARFIGSNGPPLSLLIVSNSIALLSEFPLTNSARYSLALQDAQGRTNKFPTDFVLQVLTNQRPDLKVVFPRGDQRVSKLQEMQLQAETSDDFGLLRYGVGFGVAGQDPKLVELGQNVPGQTKRAFNYVLPLEKLGVDVDQVVAYFIWADDLGPDGKPRRTYSDIFFAEVRPFDEIFRPDQSGMSADQSGGGGQGNEDVKLAELQKEIVIATWKLQRAQTNPKP
ncbi:MAG TPA: hypothetical protein VFB72_01405 [Verrucomicrobiae bacterium]|nr:hypothetical protein [Verrucomicrobiae bacterium]